MSDGTVKRLKLSIRGMVQGVGFRPFVYRLAGEMGCTGRVSNGPHGILIEAEAPVWVLERFLLRLEQEKPTRSFIQSLESSYLDPKGYSSFKIEESDTQGTPSAFISADVATCKQCLNDIFDPANRRYHYPFTNCTNCGPRFSILEALPYDRARTTMKNFTMCEACRKEYEDPNDRRYHAQPNACPSCGPSLEIWDPSGGVLAKREKALLEVVENIRQGRVVALKGLGGFHLIVDAANEAAVRRLGTRKQRGGKPFALMMPTLAMIKDYCEVSDAEERLLSSPEAPIVLLARKKSSHLRPIADSVAPRNPCLGVMLPYTPLHHILLRAFSGPVVATSGNLFEEPIVTDERRALERLKKVADIFLVHDRPIARPVDDSVVRVVMGREMVLRRSRGFAPLPFRIENDFPPVLSVGAHLKNTVAQSVGGQVFVSQHVGDLETEETFKVFRETTALFQDLYREKAQWAACDLHPAYLSTQFAERLGLPTLHVQHHYAHVLSCMAENELEAPVLGVAWDGTGFGPDGTIWGGEFLRIDEKSFSRVGSLRTFRLPGSEKAVLEPRRSALGLLFEIKDHLDPGVFSPSEYLTLKILLEKNIHSPRTSSAGRLFDAVSSMLGLCHVNRFEGQAAMELEFAAEACLSQESYPVTFLDNGDLKNFDWEAMVRGILKDLKNGVPVGEIAAKFHNTLAESIVGMSALFGEKKIVLSGGCFQNKYLLERTVRRLAQEGFSPYWHQRIPPNDGGISLGQVAAVMRQGSVVPCV